MLSSPLTQQVRPDSFQPKIVHLYEALFRDDDEELEYSEGFWQEFFLLKPDPTTLRRIVGDLPPDELLTLQTHCQQLVLQCIARIKKASSPSDRVALDTLTVFLGAILNKKYTNPSSDILSVLAGLDHADAVLADFVGALDGVIRHGRNMNLRQKAVRTALSTTAGAYQTGLISYFTHRDLFPSLMKYVQDSETSAQIAPAFALLGLLVNYNKFEFQNPYRLRLEDFVNDSTIQRIVKSVGESSVVTRDGYVAVQDDTPEVWNLGITLSKIGLGALAPGSRPATPARTVEESKLSFTSLPGAEACLLLPMYDFASANKVFCSNLISYNPESKTDSSPISSFLSLTSYLSHNAYRSERSALYCYLNMFVIRVLTEDQVLAKKLCDEGNKISPRLCRQRQPHLPPIKGDRVVAAVILDIMVDGINHNLRKRLDVEFYLLCIGVLLRIISYLGRSRVRISYHWAELWRSLLSLMRFLTTYSADIKRLSRWSELTEQTVNLIALSLSTGEAFLPDPASYDDLFYKLVETGEGLSKFRDEYEMSKQSETSSINILINVSDHYYALLKNDGKGRSRNKHLSPKEVSNLIKQGYDTLSIEAKEGLDSWERFREADYKNLLKKVARIAVEDAKSLIEDR